MFFFMQTNILLSRQIFLFNAFKLDGPMDKKYVFKSTVFNSKIFLISNLCNSQSSLALVGVCVCVCWGVELVVLIRKCQLFTNTNPKMMKQ